MALVAQRVDRGLIRIKGRGARWSETGATTRANHRGVLMYQKILVPYDGSSTSRKGLDEAIRLAKLTGATLRLIFVVDDLVYATGLEAYAVYSTDIVPLMIEAGEKALAEGKARVAAAGVPVECKLCEAIARHVCDFAADEAKSWGADLIVIGTHGRRGIGRLFLGSDAEQVVRTSVVPVLLVRATEAETAEALAVDLVASATAANVVGVTSDATASSS
jgi:nucleotide-binding universal stress UspA family protein